MQTWVGAPYQQASAGVCGCHVLAPCSNMTAKVGLEYLVDSEAHVIWQGVCRRPGRGHAAQPPRRLEHHGQQMSKDAAPMLQVKVLIQHIEARQLLPPAVVLQALAPNSHLQLGVVKVQSLTSHRQHSNCNGRCGLEH